MDRSNEAILKELEFNIKYYDKMSKAIKAKRPFLTKIYDFGYVFIVQLSFMCAGALVIKTSWVAWVAFFMCLIIGILFLAKLKSDSECLRSFEKGLKESCKIL